jgi:hypothetical protein
VLKSRFFILAMALAATARAAPDTEGQWEILNPLPFFPPHVHVMPTGKVLFWPGDIEKGGLSGNDPRIWDPQTQSVTQATKPGFDPFCSGHTFLADGRLFVAGGHISNYVGSPKGSAYNPFTNSWNFFPNMNAGRWYPTTTMLGNGDVLVVSGSINNTAGVNKLPQVFQSKTGTWRSLTSSQLGQELYPMMVLAPNGKVLNAGPEATTRYLNPSGTGAWSVVGTRAGGNRTYGTVVVYAPGKVLVVGGSDPPKKTAEVIDLNASSPTWRTVAPMSFGRRHLNATLLPDGKVLVTGGTSGPGFNNKTTPVFAAELWDPATEKWSVMASASVPRLYHSAAVLLPDGRVLTTGGNDHTETEVYSPPYLFKGARPTISSAPASVGYGQSFFVGTPDAIAKVRMIRLSSTTHSLNMGQHIAVPAFSAAAGGVNVTAPANGNLAPPGHYLLFVLNAAGVPSVGKIIQLSGEAPPPPPPPPSGAAKLASISPASATAGGPSFTLTVTGSNFVSGSVVRWRGGNRTTTFVSSTQLTATILASDIASAGTASVTVGSPGGVVSNGVTFTITSSTGKLKSMSPSSASQGSGGFTLNVTGSGFVSGSSIVRWKGSNRPTTFISPTQLSAAISAADIASAGTANVTVSTSGVVSNALVFTVTPSGPLATLGSISPSSAQAGSPGFTLTVNGSGFVSGSTVRWNGSTRTTAFVSASQLTATIPASDVASAGNATVRVASPNGALTNGITFKVNPP